MKTLHFFKAGGAARSRILGLVIAYQRKFYPSMDQVNTTLYDDFTLWGIRKQGHMIGGAMIRQSDDTAEIHVIASGQALTDKTNIEDFLSFLHYLSRRDRIKKWETMVRQDNEEARTALIHLGFRASTNNSQFIEFTKEGIVC